jgi:gamma-glutamylcyclotransferase (GGCT)/AIG2-like uncharacterized protein YtfP
MIADVRLPLFVFGTLRRGEPNHHYLAGRYVRVLPAVLSGYARRHPLMIDVQEGGEVDGELFFLDDSRYGDTLAGCDDLEGIPPGQLVGAEYQRQQVQVRTAEGTFSAWAYVQPRAPASR